MIKHYIVTMKALRITAIIIKNIFLWLLKKAVLTILFLVCGIPFVKFLVGILMEPTRDTTLLTNIGFAMFIGISSVLFSWARSLDEKRFPKQVHALNRIAVISILGSICFIFSSLFKYIALHPNDSKIWYLDKSTEFDLTVLTIASFVCIIGVMAAITLVVVGSFTEFHFLWDRLYNTVVTNPKKPKIDRRTEF